MMAIEGYSMYSVMHQELIKMENRESFRFIQDPGQMGLASQKDPNIMQSIQTSQKNSICTKSITQGTKSNTSTSKKTQKPESLQIPTKEDRVVQNKKPEVNQQTNIDRDLTPTKIGQQIHQSNFFV